MLTRASFSFPMGKGQMKWTLVRRLLKFIFSNRPQKLKKSSTVQIWSIVVAFLENMNFGNTRDFKNCYRKP